MPLPAGWTVRIGDVHRGDEGVTIHFLIRGPAGQQISLPATFSSVEIQEYSTRAQLVRAAWDGISDFALSFINYQPPAAPTPDPLVGATFTPP